MGPPSAEDRVDRPASGARLGKEGGRTVVWVWGEHDLTTADALHTTLREAGDEADDDVVVDLRELLFMDASTLGPLLRGRNRLAARKRRLTLRSPPRCARVVLDACELAYLIEPAPSSNPRVRSALETWVDVPERDRPAEAPAPNHPQGVRPDPESSDR